LKPNLALTAQYGATGRGGPYHPRDGFILPDGSVVSSLNPAIIPGGWGGALDQLFGFGFPAYGIGLQLNLPLRDRRAAADYADALVARKTDMLRLRNTEQTVRLDVLNAINQVENSRAAIELAKVSLDFANKRVEADQKKYDLGTITIFFLLDSQNALTQAQSNLVNQTVNYRKNLTNLLRFTGELLTERGIVVQ
jgi:outer membrane protein TolC